MTRREWALAVCLETVGCVAIALGLAIEAVLAADIGYMTISAGSLMIAVGSLLFSKFFK